MHTPTRIKICGITQPEDALFAASLGVDAIGMIFFSESARFIKLEAAKRIMDSIPAFVTTVGVFVNPLPQELTHILQQLPLDLLQFHGDESAEFCAAFSRPYIKSIRMREETDLLAKAQEYKTARALLLDTYHVTQWGGTGSTFDWEQVPKNIAKPIILAGGLTPENVAIAISTVHPYGVDVSGGVEQSPGKKDHAKLTQFVRNIKYVERNLS